MERDRGRETEEGGERERGRRRLVKPYLRCETAGKKRIFQTEPFVAKRENCEVMMLSQGRQKFKKKWTVVKMAKIKAGVLLAQISNWFGIQRSWSSLIQYFHAQFIQSCAEIPLRSVRLKTLHTKCWVKVSNLVFYAQSTITVISGRGRSENNSTNRPRVGSWGAVAWISVIRYKNSAHRPVILQVKTHRRLNKTLILIRQHKTSANVQGKSLFLATKRQTVH